MTLLYYDSLFLQHDTGQHPECAGRLRPAMPMFDEWVESEKVSAAKWESASLDRIARVHQRDYAEAVREFAASGGGRLEADTVVSGQSFDVALRAAGAVCDAVTRVVAGDDRRAFCAVRPPGHHALHDAPMGFCLFNNAAIGCRTAIEELQLERVLLVDWDVHHGNGSQDAFWEDPRVGFFSAHRWPFYPGTGATDETGSGQGLGTTWNMPCEFGLTQREYLRRFKHELQDFAARIQPQLVVLSAGFDAHRLDPIGSLGLESAAFEELTDTVCHIADAYGGGKLVSVLEGGYNPQALKECLELHVAALS